MIEPYPLNLLLNNRAVAVIGGWSRRAEGPESSRHRGQHYCDCTESNQKNQIISRKKKVVLNLRDFVPDDLKGKLLIFAATNSDEVNKQIAHAARKKASW